MNDQNVWEDLSEILIKQITSIRGEKIAQNVVLGFNIYNDGERIKNNRFHMEKEEYWKKHISSFRVDSIVESDDKFMINQIAGVKDFSHLEAERDADKLAKRSKWLMSLFTLATQSIAIVIGFNAYRNASINEGM